ncbi:hypothetical protein GEMRC1_001033 [Eukaryota sp. GEM-RC1]
MTKPSKFNALVSEAKDFAPPKVKKFVSNGPRVAEFVSKGSKLGNVGFTPAAPLGKAKSILDYWNRSTSGYAPDPNVVEIVLPPSDIGFQRSTEQSNFYDLPLERRNLHTRDHISSSAPQHLSCSVHEASPTHLTVIVSQLFHSMQNEYLTDALIVFHGQSYPCHSSFLSSFSPVLKEKLLSSDHEVNFPLLESILPDADLFFQILDYCYGQPLELTLDNVGFALTLATLLQISTLASDIRRVISQGLPQSRQVQLKSEEVLQTIRSKVQRDVMLSYKGKSLTMSSLVLICSCEYFKKIFCLGFSDSRERNFSYSEEFNGVSATNFEAFFNCFLGESPKLNINNVVDFYQLSVYFVVENLKETCKSFFSTVSSSRDIVTLLKTVSERNIFHLLKDNLNIFKKLDIWVFAVLPPPFPLPLEAICMLIDDVKNSWLLQCLSLSINDQIFDEKFTELTQIFEKIVVNDKNINQIFNSLLPLFSMDFLCQFLSTWSMKVFQGVQNVHVIPDEWFLWCLSQSCLNHRMCKISDFDFFIQNFSLFINPSDLSSSSNFPFLTPDVFTKFQKILSSSYDLFLINCLVKSWKETELWTTEEFKEVANSFDLQTNTDRIQISTILSTLLNDTRLAPFLNKKINKAKRVYTDEFILSFRNKNHRQLPYSVTQNIKRVLQSHEDVASRRGKPFIRAPAPRQNVSQDLRTWKTKAGGSIKNLRPSPRVYSAEFIYNLRSNISPLPTTVTQNIKKVLDTHAAEVNRLSRQRNIRGNRGRGSRQNLPQRSFSKKGPEMSAFRG